jgi:subtilisin family serine protease
MSVLAAAHAETTYKDNWYLEAIRTPTVAAANSRSDPVIIAVVDDGVRITHQDLAGFVWRNSQEIPNNRIDDDGNGFIDDIHGWDISDEDNDVVPGDRPDFYHGTHIAGIITEVAKAAYGESASDHIRILPVKSISDFEPTTYVKDGYRGIRYAIEAGADIIICAWGVGHITPEEERILREAADRGILIVSSSGNLPQELEQYPAAYESVLAVGSVERDGAKTTKSNYGQFVDMSAPGTGIRGASVLADDEYEVRDGTSFAAAMVATAAALVELNNPHLTRTDIKACLLSTSRPIDIKAREYSAKLGAGSLDIQAAVDCDLFNNPVDEETRLVHTKGFLRATGSRPGGKRTN